jgi:hypothetical protein
VPLLRWAITLLIPGKTEHLRTVTDPTFTCAVKANRFLPSEKSIVPQYWVAPQHWVVPQHWVTLIGVAFSFGFKSAIGVTMGFVRLQCLWLSVVRKPLTIKRMHFYYWIFILLLRKPDVEIDTIYRIERQDKLYKTLPQALFFCPTIVVFSALTLFLPLSGVFAPGSLTIATQNYTNITGPCVIPTGNLSHFYEAPISFFSRLTTQCFVEQRIPDLPQACGPNCRYKVHVPSFAFQCTPNPTSLPDGQAGDGGTFWNGTAYLNSTVGFYIAWNSSSPKGLGTSGNASCSPVEAQYDIEVRTILPSFLRIIFLISTPGSDERRGTICYDEHHGNYFSRLIHRRRYNKSRSPNAGCGDLHCIGGTFLHQYLYWGRRLE